MSDQPPEFGWSLPPEESSPEERPPAPPPRPVPSVQQTAGTSPPPPLTVLAPLPEQLPTTPNPPMWKRWWFIAAMVVGLAVGGMVIYAGTGEDDATQTLDDAGESVVTEDTNASDTAGTANASDTLDISDTGAPEQPTGAVTVPDLSFPEIVIPEISIPTFSGPEGVPPIPTTVSTVPAGTPTSKADGIIPVVGETVTLADGTTVRLDQVTPNAPPVQTLFEPDDGNVLTRLDFEACAGSDGFSALNPLYWAGSLDDGSPADIFLFSFDIIVVELAPGACVRGQLDMQAPVGRTITAVGVRDSIFQLVATWDTTTSVAVGGPLVAASPVVTAPIGQRATLANGATATVRSVTPNSEPLDPSFPADSGRQLARIDVEVCAGSSGLVVSAQNWFGTTTDARIGTASSFGTTFPSAELAAGQCGSGLIDLDLSADAPVGDIILGDEQSVEAARWRVG